MLEINCMSSVRNFAPRPRTRGLTAQEVDGDLLLYAEDTHQASCLNSAAAHIWRLCDGARTVESIAAAAGFDAEVVGRAVKQFGEAGLIENAGEFPIVVDLARRRVLAGVGLAAIPIVLLVTAPEARANGSICTPVMDHCDSGTPPCCDHGTCMANTCVP
jgi:hypothetical protein